MYNTLADLAVLLHFGFIVFVAFGWLLVMRWRQIAPAHVPAVIWGVLIELFGWTCPLTGLENWLRRRGGTSGYVGGFVEAYVIPIVYPTALTRGHQVLLGLALLALNGAAYLWLVTKWLRGDAPSNDC